METFPPFAPDPKETPTPAQTVLQEQLLEQLRHNARLVEALREQSELWKEIYPWIMPTKKIEFFRQSDPIGKINAAIAGHEYREP